MLWRIVDGFFFLSLSHHERNKRERYKFVSLWISFCNSEVYENQIKDRSVWFTKVHLIPSLFRAPWKMSNEDDISGLACYYAITCEPSNARGWKRRKRGRKKARSKWCQANVSIETRLSEYACIRACVHRTRRLRGYDCVWRQKWWCSKVIAP